MIKDSYKGDGDDSFSEAQMLNLITAGTTLPSNLPFRNNYIIVKQSASILYLLRKHSCGKCLISFPHC